MGEGMKKGPIIGNSVILVFFLFMLFESFKLHEIRRFGDVGSGFWPILVLALASILSASLLFSSLRKGRKKGEKESESEVPPSPDSIADRKRARNIVILSSLATLVYIFAMQWVGFAIGTLLYVLAFILILGERRKWVVIFSPLLVTVFILVVFSKFISIPFPRGVGVFADLSRFFF
jgi:putative tricarboxylic transport membrane protein